VIDDTKWYYLRDGKSLGPFTKDQLTQMVFENAISKETLIWNASQNEQWKQLAEVFDLKVELPPPLPISSEVQKSSDKKKIDTQLTPHPWRRYFARMLDCTVNGVVAGAALGLIGYAVMPIEANQFFTYIADPKHKFADIFFTYLIVPFPNAAFIGFTGSSIGKWCFGVKVVDQADRAIGYPKALKRELLVWLYGLGLGIPILSFIAMLLQKSQLEKNKVTQWDEDLDLKIIYRDNGWQQNLLSFLGIVLFILATVIIAKL